MPKEIRDSSIPAEHIGQIPAGHERDEENRRRTDALAEQATGDDDGGTIPEKALEEEREILQHFDPYSYQLEVTKPQPGRHYLWVIANATVISAYRANRYEMVQGKDPECENHRGQHKAAGSSMRGVGDCLLMWTTIDNYEQLEARNRRKADAMMGVEENWEADVNGGQVGRSFGPLAHGKRTDPLLQRTVLRGSMGQVSHLMDEIKKGTVPGIKPGDFVRG